MPDWVPYLLVFLAGLILGRLTGRARDGAPRIPSPPRPLPPDALVRIEQLIRDRRKIEAIKAYREATGAGLKDAKEAVEALQARQPGS